MIIVKKFLQPEDHSGDTLKIVSFALVCML
jgi:hypothetical protein